MRTIWQDNSTASQNLNQFQTANCSLSVVEHKFQTQIGRLRAIREVLERAEPHSTLFFVARSGVRLKGLFENAQDTAGVMQRQNRRTHCCEFWRDDPADCGVLSSPPPSFPSSHLFSHDSQVARTKLSTRRCLLTMGRGGGECYHHPSLPEHLYKQTLQRRSLANRAGGLTRREFVNASREGRRATSTRTECGSASGNHHLKKRTPPDKIPTLSQAPLRAFRGCSHLCRNCPSC